MESIAFYENGKLVRVISPKPRRLELILIRGSDETSFSSSQGLLRQPKYIPNDKEAKKTECQAQGGEESPAK